MELMSKDFYEGTETDDYLQITLTDEEDVRMEWQSFGRYTRI